jgi:phage baseplate assembly protein V
MAPQLVDLLAPEARRVIPGLITGTVTDNKDPDGLGRVRVHFPSLGDDSLTPWARMAVPMAGDQHGFYTLPEVGDEVVVGFEHGNPEYPYVLGALWNSGAKPPESNSNGTNDHRSLTSRSGHVIRLDDTSGQEQIQIIDKSTNNTIVISSANNTIEIKAQGDITIASSGGKLSLQGTDVEITAQQSLTAKAQSSASFSAQSQMTIKGAQVAIN